MPTRRELLTFWLDALTAASDPPIPEAEPVPEALRPPGAIAEQRMIELCERGGACAKACPHDVILPLGVAYGAACGTPAIVPRDGPCRLCSDLPCARACPSGALRPVPVAEVRLGTARLDPDRCWAALGQPCDYCVKECPLGEKALTWKDGRPEVITEACVGCGMCVTICTATPAALRVVPLRF